MNSFNLSTQPHSTHLQYGYYPQQPLVYTGATANTNNNNNNMNNAQHLQYSLTQSNNINNNFQAVNNRQLNNTLPRRQVQQQQQQQQFIQPHQPPQFMITSQTNPPLHQIQSVPKFNQLAPVVKL